MPIIWHCITTFRRRKQMRKTKQNPRLKSRRPWSADARKRTLTRTELAHVKGGTRHEDETDEIIRRSPLDGIEGANHNQHQLRLVRTRSSAACRTSILGSSSSPTV